MSARPLVDDRGGYGFGKVARAFGFAAGIDEAHAAHVAVGYLVAAKIDRMIGAEFAVHFRMRLAECDSRITAVVGRQFLLNDIGLYRYAEVVGLTGQVGGGMIVFPSFLKPGLRR